MPASPSSSRSRRPYARSRSSPPPTAGREHGDPYTFPCCLPASLPTYRRTSRTTASKALADPGLLGTSPLPTPLPSFALRPAFRLGGTQGLYCHTGRAASASIIGSSPPLISLLLPFHVKTAP